MVKLLILACATGLLIVLAVAIQPLFLLRMLQTTSVIYYGDTTQKRLAITIDDGPDKNSTNEILDVLRRHGVSATFFLISSRIPGQEDLVRRIVREGHELGNHHAEETMSIWLSDSLFSAGLRQAQEALRIFGPVRWFRPGSGFYNARMVQEARKLGYRTALGSVYPFDVTVRSATLCAAYIRRMAFAGGIIVLHDGRDRGHRTAKILDRVIPELLRRGFTFHTLSELAGEESGGR